MPKKAILLANLGSPNSTSVKDLKTYLNEFLMDERVIDIPYIFRYLLIRGILVPNRASKSAEKYKTIWTENGSPLIHTTVQLAKLVESETGLPTYVCMRYGDPTAQSAMEKIVNDHPQTEEVILLPLYPHYAMSSYETAVVHVEQTHEKGGFPFKLSVVPPYYKDNQYLTALANSIKPYLEKEYDRILFSYHGIPERHLRKTDPTGSHCMKCENCCERPSVAHEYCYRHQVLETTKRVTDLLNIPPNKYSVSFQSRLGPDKWLEPSTSGELKRFPGDGIKKLIVVCPAFVSDCLETLEEIWVEGKEDFEKAGGETFEVVPCLNINPEWVKTIDHLIEQSE